LLPKKLRFCFATQTLQIFTVDGANCLYFILPEFQLMNIIRCSLPNFGNEIRFQVDVRVSQSKTEQLEGPRSFDPCFSMGRNSGAFFFAELEASARIQSLMHGSSLLREGGSRASLPEGWKIL
jgi:hypothetical protein